MNDFQGPVWFVAQTDHEVAVYRRECIFFCSILLLIAALALFYESGIKYVVWGMLPVAYLLKKCWL